MSLKMFALAGLAPAALMAAPSVQAGEFAPGDVVHGGSDLSGFYVYTEANSDWRGSDYEGTSIDVRVGYETELSETVSGYVEVGPAFSVPESGDAETDIGAEVGLSVAATENLELYAEFEVISGDEFDYGTKAGVKYSF